MIIYGLSGGISTGKSFVSNVLRSEGCVIIDSDLVAREVVNKGKWGYRRVVRVFGSEILKSDGEIDRKKLGALIFNDVDARKKLNRATHTPILLNIFLKLIYYWLTCTALVIVDMPLLFELGVHKWTNDSILVMCSQTTQLQRLMSRDSITEAEALAKINSQMPMSQKLSMAGIVISNDGTREVTREQIKQVLPKLKSHTSVHKYVLGPQLVLIVAGIDNSFLGRQILFNDCC